MTYSPYREGAIVQLADGGTGRINSISPMGEKVGVTCNNLYRHVPIAHVTPIKVFVDESYLQALKDAQNKARKDILGMPTFKHDTPISIRWRAEDMKRRLRKLRETYDMAVAEREYVFGAKPTPEPAVPAPRYQRWFADLSSGAREGWSNIFEKFRRPIYA
jgi:hypothetical protein